MRRLATHGVVLGTYSNLCIADLLVSANSVGKKPNSYSVQMISRALSPDTMANNVHQRQRSAWYFEPLDSRSRCRRRKGDQDRSSCVAGLEDDHAFGTYVWQTSIRARDTEQSTKDSQ